MQEADQLRAVAMLLGNHLDRLILWCCVEGALQGVQVQLIFASASGLLTGSWLADSWPAFDPKEPRDRIEQLWPRALSSGVELCTYAVTSHFAVSRC